MALAPTCKLCGARHALGAPHVFAAQPKTTRSEPKVTAPTAQPAPPAPREQTLAEYLAAERARKAAYMRAYRAKQKA